MNDDIRAIEPGPRMEDLDFKKIIFLQINRVNLCKARTDEFFNQVENLQTMVEPYLTSGDIKDKIKEAEKTKVKEIADAPNEFEENQALYKFYREIYKQIIRQLDKKGWLLGRMKPGGDLYEQEQT